MSAAPQQDVSGRWPHTGAVLIGGASSRMGTPKHELALRDGRTMLEHVIDALRPICTNIVTVGRAIQPSPRIDVRHVTDLREACQGPLAGIEALLASDIDAEYLVAGCDMPRLTADLLAPLTRPSHAMATLIHLEGRDRPEPLPLRITIAALPNLRLFLDSNQRALWQFLETIHTEVVRIPNRFASALTNINTPQELGLL